MGQVLLSSICPDRAAKVMLQKIIMRAYGTLFATPDMRLIRACFMCKMCGPMRTKAAPAYISEVESASYTDTVPFAYGESRACSTLIQGCF